MWWGLKWFPQSFLLMCLMQKVEFSFCLHWKLSHLCAMMNCICTVWVLYQTPLSSAVDVEIKVLIPLIVSLSSQSLLSSLKMRFVSGKSPELCAFVRMKNYPNVRSTLSRGWEQGGRNCGILDMKICIFEIFHLFSRGNLFANFCAQVFSLHF